MFLIEPQPTQFDLNFRIFDIPVRVHPFFWLAGLLFGASGSGNDIAIVLIAIGAFFVSILVHEFGHALVMKRYGDSPRVVLYAMGGLAIPDRGNVWNLSSGRTRGPIDQIIISAAGPAAGFLLAGLVLGIIMATGGRTIFFPRYLQFLVTGYGNKFMNHLLILLLNFNIFWGVVNLLPVYPLDGGQIAHQLLIMRDPWAGMRKTLMLSAITATIAAIVGFVHFKNQFMALLFASLAISSYLSMQQMGGGRGRPW